MEFKPLNPMKRWHGRYARIPGKTTAFHVVASGRERRPALLWYRDGDLLTCHMLASSQATRLGHVVDQGKQWLGGAPGGAFHINEFGQVLVPTNMSGNFGRAYVGDVTGSMEFTDPETGSTFTLRRQDRLSPGAAWDLPYVGIPFNLSKASRIYFWQEDADGGRKIEPQGQDAALIAAIRAIRRTGAVRFIVTPYGDVVTKRTPLGAWQQEETWEPVYVGRISPLSWFRKEQ